MRCTVSLIVLVLNAFRHQSEVEGPPRSQRNGPHHVLNAFRHQSEVETSDTAHACALL